MSLLNKCSVVANEEKLQQFEEASNVVAADWILSSKNLADVSA